MSGSTLSILLFGLIIIGVTGFAVAFYLQLQEKSRRDVVDRTLGVSSNAEVRRAIRKGLGNENENSLRARMLKKAPSIWAQDESIQQRLVKAGFDGPIAPLVYSMTRLIVLVGLPLLVFILLPQTTFIKTLVAVGAAAFFGLLLPPLVLCVSRQGGRKRFDDPCRMLWIFWSSASRLASASMLRCFELPVT
jgi:hypothetical protein